MTKRFQSLLLAALVITPIASTVVEATPRANRSPRAVKLISAPPRLTGVVKGVTESRLFIETEPGVEQVIRIDGRTRVAHHAMPQVGEVVEVELDRTDIIKSALTISAPPTQLAKK